MLKLRGRRVDTDAKCVFLHYGSVDELGTIPKDSDILWGEGQEVCCLMSILVIGYRSQPVVIPMISQKPRLVLFEKIKLGLSRERWLSENLMELHIFTILNLLRLVILKNHAASIFLVSESESYPSNSIHPAVADLRTLQPLVVTPIRICSPF